MALEHEENPEKGRLEFYYRIVDHAILDAQNPFTGLFKANNQSDHAWVRDNVYSTIGVWALSLAFKKASDSDRVKVLERATVKCMRGLLTSIMRQSDKVEKFKSTSSPSDSVHAKFSVVTGLPVVGDTEWGHLQIDAISLYLLTLAQMTSSGLQIIYTLDEVAFIQNLVFYIESSYSTPDYGIWERGDKSNTGIVELNSSSIGMAVAALEAIDELDLFGVQGGHGSKIHVMMDEAFKCKAILHSMLPRESLSKEADSALLTVTGFPAFAVEKQDLLDRTMEEIVTKLERTHGCIRFLRDGYKTPIEDSSRLHYWEWELRLFENMECEWPLFFCNMIINHCFMGNEDEALRYAEMLKDQLVYVNGLPMVPEIYAVSREGVGPNNLNQEDESDQGRQMKASGRVPFMWAESLFVIGGLLMDKLVACGELDPVNRRLSSQPRPETVVQVVLLANDKKVQDLLYKEGFSFKTVSEVESVEVHPARVLSELYTYLGKNEKLGLSGRKSRNVGILMTSKLYRIQGRLFAFTPQRFDSNRNYLDCDSSVLVSALEYGLNNLSTNWSAPGRPIFTLIMGDNIIEDGKVARPIVSAIRKLKNGLIDSTRVIVGNFEKFLATSCIKTMSWLNSYSDGAPSQLLPEVERYISKLVTTQTFSARLLRPQLAYGGDHDRGILMRKNSVRGQFRRTRTQESRKTSGGSSVGSNENLSIRRQDSIACFDEESAVEFQTEEHKKRLLENSPYQQLSLNQLLEMATLAANLEEQTDIIHYLILKHGIDKKVCMPVDDQEVELRTLVKTLYENACMKKQWDIVRHCAGQLGKRVDDLSKTVTDLLVRQKQVTVGLPPREHVISGVRLKSRDLVKIIYEVCQGDVSMAMLTQEIMLYLSMFIQTEPELFHGMLRLRIGLIINVMAAEMQRSLKMKADADATEELMSLSPHEMRKLLHHIMAGKEFDIHLNKSAYSVVCEDRSNITQALISKARLSTSTMGTKKSVKAEGAVGGATCPADRKASLAEEDSDSDSDENGDRQGSWIRRRRVDGALNRVPVGFYEQIWNILQKCSCIAVHDDKNLYSSLTQSMTSGEMKFALEVESVLNTVRDPEYRMLLVETVSVLAMMVESGLVPMLDDSVRLEAIVHEANRIFLKDQLQQTKGLVVCCNPDPGTQPSMGVRQCSRAGGVCRYFYDSAPSGTYGTLSYLIRAACVVLASVPNEGYVECATQ